MKLVTSQPVKSGVVVASLMTASKPVLDLAKSLQYAQNVEEGCARSGVPMRDSTPVLTVIGSHPTRVTYKEARPNGSTTEIYSRRVNR